MGLGSYVRNRKAVKASRASLNGIAGHQAAMKALGNAAGWDKMSLFGTEMAISKKPGLSFKPGEGNLESNTIPDQGHAVEYYQNIAPSPSGRYRGLNTVKGGTAGIEPGAIDRHKPTEDF